MMELIKRTCVLFVILFLCGHTCESAKINTPRVLLPWFDNLHVNFTFEIVEGGCYTWSLSRDDIIELEPLYEDSWGHCSRAARVSVSKTCVPPGSVIILAEEVNTGEILRGDVDVDKINSLKVMSTTWKLYLEQAPEAFEVVAYDDQGNTFSTLEGVTFTWSIQNLRNNVDEHPLVTLVRWKDTDYEAPRGIAALEAIGSRSYSVLLYGQAVGDCKVTVCLDYICTDFDLQVIAGVVLTPANAIIAPGDNLRYKVVRPRAGRLTIQNVAETLYKMQVPQTGIATLEDSLSLVRGTDIGTTVVYLMSGITEVATATLTVAEPHSIKVILRPSELLISGEQFLIHCVVLDVEGRALTAGQETLIRLSVQGEANVELLTSTDNGTLTDAVAHNAGPVTITARLHSIAGKQLWQKVEGQVSAVVVDPLEIVPPELYVAWTDAAQDIQLVHNGGGNEPVSWSLSEGDKVKSSAISLAPTGMASIHGIGDVEVRVQMKKHPHIYDVGRVWSAPPEYIQVSSTGFARVGRPHYLHVALTATNPVSGEYSNFHVCNCATFAVSLLEGPEPHNVTSATWVDPLDGACCVLEVRFTSRGVSTLRVSRGRLGDTARVPVRAAPKILWPENVAALVGASLPVLAEGESLIPESTEPRVSDIATRHGSAPVKYPDVEMFTMKCIRKGDSRLQLTSSMDDERETSEFEAACAPHVNKIRLEPTATPGNCSGARIWLRPGQEVYVRVTLLDAIGRQLLDERGPKMKWEIEPKRPGIEFLATDRLYVETDPEYDPVPVPFKYYQMIVTDDQAIGWNGAIKASIPEATASIQARVVEPLRIDPVKVHLAWEGETVTNIGKVTGGSGKYTVESPKGVSAYIEDGTLSAVVPGPGSYDLVVVDLCVQGEKQMIEVHIEEVLNVEVSTSRAICVGACVPLTALVKGVSHRYLTSNQPPEWRATGDVLVKDGEICGLREGTGRVRAARASLWSSEVEVLVFPPLEIVPSVARIPPGARLQLRHEGGPPSHLATLHYKLGKSSNVVEVSTSGALHGLSIGTARIKLVALDIANVELASAESEVEVIPISGLRVRAATQTLLVGRPAPLWLEATSLTAGSLGALQPPPRVVFSVREAGSARVYSSHADDFVDRSIAEGLSVRVVPLKPGLITIDVRVRNMGQVAETRTWDSTIEILGISDIRSSVEGLPEEINTGERLSLAVGASIKLKSLPRGSWNAVQSGAFELTAAGELKAISPGYGVVVVQHKDDRNNIYRESSIHVQVSLPHYCTAEPSGDASDGATRVVLRDSVGRELIAPHSDVTVSFPAHIRRSGYSALGNEIILVGLDASGAFLTFTASSGGVAVRDEVLVHGGDAGAERVLACGSWAICLEGVGWRGPPDVTIWPGAGVSLAVLSRDVTGKHDLRLSSTGQQLVIHQAAIHKMEFLPGEWPSAMVPLSIEAPSLTNGPLLCTEQQKYALDGVQVDLPYLCRVKQPHSAKPVLDITNGHLACSVMSGKQVTEASEIDLCAEWGAYRTCTKVLLLPLIRLSHTKVSLLSPPTEFVVSGHPHALKVVKITATPGLKLEFSNRDGEIHVQVKSETVTCGVGWVSVLSRLTMQEERVEVEKECDITSGTLLGALFSLIRPYLSTLVTIAAVIATYMYIQHRLHQKSQIRLPMEPMTVFPQSDISPTINRSRTLSRSPYASNGPSAPVYGDASVLPDASFSPNTTRIHSRFL